MSEFVGGGRGRELLARFRTDPVGFLQDLASTDGATVTFRFAGRNLTLLKDAELIEQVLVKQQSSFVKGPGLLRLRPLLGQGLLTANGKEHATNRRHLQPAFTPARIAQYGQSIPAIISDTTESWRDGSEIDVFREMSRLTLAVVSTVLLKTNRPPESETVSAAIAKNMSALYRPLMTCPYGSNGARTPIERLSGEIADILSGHQPDADGADLLSLIKTSGRSDEDTADEVATFLMGGHESVGIALTWTVYAMSQNQAVRQLFESEVDAIEEGRLPSAPLSYTHQIIAEALRLYPPAWMVSREATEETEIGGVKYSPGSIFIAAPCITHRDPRYWDDPESFRPERWEPHSSDTTRPRYAYFPFGAGSRRCIGEQFALTELAQVLAHIGKKWQFDPPKNGYCPRFEPIVTLRPKDGLQMVLRRRAS